jgi:GntR family transcriptional regulator/MocR family aminotransferase
VDDLPIELDRSGSEPLAVQVADALRAAASTGALRVGDRLSSTRQLAARLGVSRTVTSAAYDQLLAEGWLSGRRGSGTFITAAPPSGPAPGGQRADRTGGRPAEQPFRDRPMADLTSGRPCVQVLDRAAWRRAWRAAADEPPAAEVWHGGHPAFAAAVIEHLLRHRGLAARPDQVLATSGTTAAMAELAALLPRGAHVAVEEPGYQRGVRTLQAAGLRVTGVPVDGNGLRVDLLPDGLAAVYCTPAHQFPLGARLSAQRRVELVRRARRDRFLIMEDDYDGELRYDVAPLPLLASLGPDVVAHLGTASKLLSPTLGAGWLVAPRPLHDGVLAARRTTGVRPGPAGQLVFTALADYGDLARHLRRLRRELAERRTLVVERLAERGVAAQGDAAGAHVAIRLRTARAERTVAERAAAEGVIVPVFGDYHSGPAAVFGLAVGYAAPTRAALERGVEVIARLVAQERDEPVATLTGHGTPLI